jgi:hypothetical protein
MSKQVGGLRTVGPSTVRVPGGVMPQKPSGTPITQAARIDTFARIHLWKRVVIFEPTLKERPRVGGGASGGQSETLEGSCLTFTPKPSALHSVPLARQGRVVRQNESPAQQEKGGILGNPHWHLRGKPEGLRRVV